MSRMMKTSALFAVVLGAFRLSAMADPADDYLVRAYVPAKDGIGERPARVVSFVPRDSRVWDDRRLSNWRRRVASLFSGSDAAAGEPLAENAVLVREAGSSVEVRVERGGLALPQSLLDSVGEAMEVVPFITASGSFALTNRYAFSSQPDGGARRFFVALRQEPASMAGALIPARLAGHSVWLLSWPELDARWTRNLKTDPSLVRAEIEAVRQCLLARDTRFGGAGIWRERIDKWLADRRHGAVWPRVVFENAYEGSVRVDFGTRSRVMRPGEAWTNSLPSVPGGRLTWSFVPVGGSGKPESADDYDYSDERAFAIDWSPDGRDDVVKTVHGGLLVRKSNPRLSVDSGLIPSAEARRLLQPGDLLVSVKYAGVSNPVQRPVNGVGTGATPWIELDAHRKIESIVVEEGKYWQRASIRPEKDSYSRGEIVRVSQLVPLKPWPSLILSNPATDRAVTNALEALGTGGQPVPSVFLPSTVVLEPGQTQVLGSEIGKRFAERVGDGRDESSPLRFTVRIVSSADYADTVTNEVEYVRVGGEVAVECRPELHEIPPPPEPEKLAWLPADPRAKNSLRRLFGSLEKRIRREMPFDQESDASFRSEVARRAYGNPDEPVTADSPAVAILRHHLDVCDDPDCPDCVPFRRRNGDWLPQDGSAPDNAGAFVALYHEFLLSNPRSAGEAGPENATAALQRRMEPRTY